MTRTLAKHTFGEVQEEEVQVEDGLCDTSDCCNNIGVVLGVVAVDPVQKVESPVADHDRQVVEDEVLCLACLAH